MILYTAFCVYFPDEDHEFEDLMRGNQIDNRFNGYSDGVFHGNHEGDGSGDGFRAVGPGLGNGIGYYWKIACQQGFYYQ